MIQWWGQGCDVTLTSLSEPPLTFTNDQATPSTSSAENLDDVISFMEVPSEDVYNEVSDDVSPSCTTSAKWTEDMYDGNIVNAIDSSEDESADDVLTFQCT